MPKQSNEVISQIRFLLGDTFGTYYLVIGLGVFLISLFLAGAKDGKSVLGGQDEKPKYSFFAWGSMMFTAGLAADMLFYSFSEWILYATYPHMAELGSIQDWASVYPVFHWSLSPWGFYLVLAVAFGFMLHVRKRDRQKYSEACRPILGKHTDGILGRLIDLLAVFALIAGTATTFSLATPLMASVINVLFGVELNRVAVTIIILIITCIVYTYSLLHGFKGISILAKACIYLFFGLLAFVRLFGGEARYIIETVFSALGRLSLIHISVVVGQYDETASKEVFTLLNEYRVEKGLNPLQPANLALQAAANIRGREMEKMFGHVRPNGEDCFSVYEASCAENIDVYKRQIIMCEYATSFLGCHHL